MERTTIHDRIERDRKNAQPDGFAWSDVRKFRRYYRGRQRPSLNAEQIRILQGVIGNRFSHNVLKKIVTEKANRLEIARFDVDDDQVRDFLFDTWVKNEFPDVFADLIVATLRDSNAFLGLNWVVDDSPDSVYGGRVSFKTERLWDGRVGTFAHYDNADQMEYAVKEWHDPTTRTQYRTVYFDDHMERYRQDGASWVGYFLPTDPFIDGLSQRGFVPWLKRSGDGLGIPIIHFANGSDDDSPYGASELDGGALGFQDQINAIQHDITAVSTLSGSPRTWSKGFTLEKDANGNRKQPRVGPGAHWHSDEVDADWGVLAGGDPKPLIDALWLKVQSLCQMTNIPMHVITGDWPSGEAIYRAEMSLTQDVQRLAKKTGPSASTAMHRSTEIANAYGTGPTLNETALIRTIFVDASKRDPLTRALFVEKVAPHVSKQEILRLFDYTPDQIDAIIEELEEEADKALERAQARFSAGVAVPSTVRPGNDEPPVEDEEDE